MRELNFHVKVDFSAACYVCIGVISEMFDCLVAESTIFCTEIGHSGMVLHFPQSQSYDINRNETADNSTLLETMQMAV